MIKFKQKGDFSKTDSFFEKIKEAVGLGDLDRYGREGVRALSSATPVDTGKTADSWSYKITRTKDSIILAFDNSNFQNGVPIAIILQYGHATRNGGWIEGIDYINPAVRPIFNNIVNEMWEEVKRS